MQRDITGISIGTTEALLFGALISPTDPIAVIEMLQRVGAPPDLKSQLAGESLFNDGVGAVIFVALLDASKAGSTHHGLPSPTTFAALMLLQAGGGLALGGALGYLTYRLIRMVDSYRVEVMLTLALAMGGYPPSPAALLYRSRTHGQTGKIAAPGRRMAAGTFIYFMRLAKCR